MSLENLIAIIKCDVLLWVSVSLSYKQTNTVCLFGPLMRGETKFKLFGSLMKKKNFKENLQNTKTNKSLSTQQNCYKDQKLNLKSIHDFSRTQSNVCLNIEKKEKKKNIKACGGVFSLTHKHNTSEF